MASLIGARPAKEAGEVVGRRVRAALKEIGKPGPLSPRLHAARLDLKKARAALKLLRAAIGRKAYKRENALCREAGRLLRRARDAQALEAAWRKLGMKRPRISRELAAQARRPVGKAEVGKSLDLLAIARRLARRLAPEREGWGGVKGGLRRSYCAAKRAWRRASRTAAEPEYHEWRKRVKDLRYQTDLFKDGSRDLGALRQGLARLSDALGDEHDLALLGDKVGRRDAAVRAEIGRRRARLRSQALGLARPVLAASADGFVREVRKAWKAAR